MFCSRPASVGTVLLLLVALGAGVGPAAGESTTGREAIQISLDELSALGKAVNRSYAPFRRGAPADTAAWAGLADLHADLGRLADGAARLRDRVEVLRAESGFQPAVRRGEFRRRLAQADSLIAEAHRLAASDWRTGRPDDAEEARGWVLRRAQAAKRLADRTATAAGDAAYAVGVTEGVGGRTLNLSLVGIVVVFGVLALIALVVGLIRRLDDGWQTREEEAAAAALARQPTIDATTLVLIAAACATLITGRHRVRRIRRLLSPKQKRTPWSAQGRLILQGSHTVDRRSN